MSRAARLGGGRTLAVLAGATLALTPWPGVAWGAFAAVVGTSGSSFDSYTVPVPTGLRCGGLSTPATSRILWDAVAPPAGQTINYLVTTPSGSTTTTAATSFNLPPVTLTSGQYAVRAQISSGWSSAPTTITIGLTVLGLLYTCSTP